MIRKKSNIFLLLLVCRTVLSDEVIYNINTMKAINIVSDKFLSISIDPAVLLTGLNLSEKSLALARHLSPAYIRIAGPSTNHVHYTVSSNSHQDSESSEELQVTPAMWFGVTEWLSAANMTPVFGLNDQVIKQGVWNPKSALPMLELSYMLNVTCGWQLGYDCSNKTQVQYKGDLMVLHQILNAFSNPGKEPWKIIGSDLSKCLDTTTSTTSPATLKETLEDLQQISNAVMWEPEDMDESNFPQKDAMFKLLTSSNNNKPLLPVWTTAPKPSQSISFSTAITWMKQISEAARNGFNVVFRQPRLHELFSDSPAYWASVLHKNFMGQTVIDIKSTTLVPDFDVYAHCTKGQNHFSKRGAMTILVINNSTKENVAQIRLASTYKAKTIEIQSYILSAPYEASPKVYLNDEMLTTKMLKDNKVLFEPKLRRAKVSKLLSLAVPPKSIAFFVLPGSKVPVCINEEKEVDLLMEEINEDQTLPVFDDIDIPVDLETRTATTLKEMKNQMKKEFDFDEKYQREHTTKHAVTEKTRDVRERLKKQEKIVQKFNFIKEKPKERNIINKKNINDNADLELTSEEIKKILKDRAQAKAESKHIKFTSEELDELMKRASEKFLSKDRTEFKIRRKVKRAIGDHSEVSRRDINTRLLELRTNIENRRNALMNALNNRTGTILNRRNNNNAPTNMLLTSRLSNSRSQAYENIQRALANLRSRSNHQASTQRPSLLQRLRPTTTTPRSLHLLESRHSLTNHGSLNSNTHPVAHGTLLNSNTHSATHGNIHETSHNNLHQQRPNIGNLHGLHGLNQNHAETHSNLHNHDNIHQNNHGIGHLQTHQGLEGGIHGISSTHHQTNHNGLHGNLHLTPEIGQHGHQNIGHNQHQRRKRNVNLDLHKLKRSWLDNSKDYKIKYQDGEVKKATMRQSGETTAELLRSSEEETEMTRPSLNVFAKLANENEDVEEDTDLYSKPSLFSDVTSKLKHQQNILAKPKSLLQLHQNQKLPFQHSSLFSMSSRANTEKLEPTQSEVTKGTEISEPLQFLNREDGFESALEEDDWTAYPSIHEFFPKESKKIDHRTKYSHVDEIPRTKLNKKPNLLESRIFNPKDDMDSFELFDIKFEDYDSDLEGMDDGLRFRRAVDSVSKDDLKTYRKQMGENLKYLREKRKRNKSKNQGTELEDASVGLPYPEIMPKMRQRMHVKAIEAEEENKPLRPDEEKLHFVIGDPEKAAKKKITEQKKERQLNFLRSRLAIKKKKEEKTKNKDEQIIKEETIEKEVIHSDNVTPTSEDSMRRKRSLQEDNQIIKMYTPLSNSFNQWKPADIMTIDKDPRLLTNVIDFEPINDNEIFKNFFRNKNQIKYKRDIDSDLDSNENKIDLSSKDDASFGINFKPKYTFPFQEIMNEDSTHEGNYTINKDEEDINKIENNSSDHNNEIEKEHDSSSEKGNSSDKGVILKNVTSGGVGEIFHKVVKDMGDFFSGVYKKVAGFMGFANN